MNAAMHEIEKHGLCPPEEGDAAVCGGGLRSPATPASSPAPGAPGVGEEASRRLARLRESVWTPVACKAVGALFVLAAVAALGVSATRETPAGIVVRADDTEWLAGDEGEGPESASRSSAAEEDDSDAIEAAAQSTPPGAATRLASATAEADGARGKPVPCAAEPKAESAGVTSDGKVILNVATAEELTRLPGVGQRRAEAIVQLRERLGKFRRVTDLLRVRGIGVRSLRRIQPLVVLNPPEPEVPPETESAKPSAPGAPRSSGSADAPDRRSGDS